MSIFKSTAMMEEIFGEIWGKLITEGELGQKLKKSGLSVLYRIHDPEMTMYLDENGVLFGKEAEARTPTVIQSMEGDIVHKFWLNKLNVPKALALRQVKAKGPVTKLLQLMPLLKPAQSVYPEYCRKYNLPME